MKKILVLILTVVACFFSFKVVEAATLVDYTGMAGADSNTTFNNVTPRYYTIDTRTIQTISSFSLKMNDNSTTETYTLLLMSPDLSVVLATSTVSANNSGIGQEVWTFNNIDVSAYDSVALKLFNSNGSYRTIYYRNDSNQAINWGYTKIISHGGASAIYNTQTPLTVLTGTLRPDNCPVCEVCDPNDNIPGDLPYLNDATIVTGYTEHYNSSSTLTETELKYYHVPVIALVILGGLFLYVGSRLIAEILKRLSQK